MLELTLYSKVIHHTCHFFRFQKWCSLTILEHCTRLKEQVYIFYFPTIDSWTWTDQEAFITSNYIYVWSSWMLMCSGTSLSSSESLVTFSFVEDPRLDEKEIGRGTSQEGFWDSGKMLVDWINRATSIVEVTNNRGENVSFYYHQIRTVFSEKIQQQLAFTFNLWRRNIEAGKPEILSQRFFSL